MYVAISVWIHNWDSYEGLVCMNQVTHEYMVTTSVNCINRWFVLPLRQVIGKWFHLCLENVFWVSAWTFMLHALLLTHHLVVLIPLLDENWCRYFFCVYLPFIEQDYFSLGCFLWLSPVQASAFQTLPWPWSLDLNHCKGCLQYGGECMSTVVGFSYMILQNVYSWWKSCLPLVTLRGFPIRSSLGIPISQSLCALLSWVVVVFHPLGVYYPFCVYQR